MEKQLKTLKDFTPEIQAKIPEYIERYTKGISKKIVLSLVRRCIIHSVRCLRIVEIKDVYKALNGLGVAITISMLCAY